MKELEFKLKTKSVVTSEDKEEQEKYTYVPADPDLAKKVKIAISQSIDSDVIEEMGLPTEIGDKIFIEFGSTNRQTKLVSKIEDVGENDDIAIIGKEKIQKRAVQKVKQKKKGKGF
jgi:hypothetical protein